MYYTKSTLIIPEIEPTMDTVFMKPIFNSSSGQRDRKDSGKKEG